jgi:hypothetical protein
MAGDALVTPSTSDVTQLDHSLKWLNEDQLEVLSLPPITPTITSRASSIPPTDAGSEDSDHTSTAAKQSKKK